MTTPLWQLDAADLVAGYGDGRFTPVDALDACLARSEAVQPHVNAVVAFDVVAAREAAARSAERWRDGAALGPLDGVPVSVKDSLHVRGMPTRWGSRSMSPSKAIADAVPVARCRAAGALLFAKTNVPEFTMQGYTDNDVFGATGNPWAPHLTAGGSSGGAAALVAAGGGPIALATDGGGSIRRPASHTGLVGLKPSQGRVRRGDGVPGVFLDHEVVGSLSRTVRDAVTTLRVIGDRFTDRAFEEPVDATSIRLLYLPRFAKHPVDAGVRRLTRQAVDRLAAAGCVVTVMPRFDAAERVHRAWPLLGQVGLAWLVDHPQGLGIDGAQLDTAVFSPALQAHASTGRDARATALFDLFVEIGRLREIVQDLFAQHDFLVTPSAATLPWSKVELFPPRIDDEAVAAGGHAVFTGFVNACGLPAIALPCGSADGLPVGLQLVGRIDGDERLLAVAGWVGHVLANPVRWPLPDVD